MKNFKTSRGVANFIMAIVLAVEISLLAMFWSHLNLFISLMGIFAAISIVIAIIIDLSLWGDESDSNGRPNGRKSPGPFAFLYSAGSSEDDGDDTKKVKFKIRKLVIWAVLIICTYYLIKVGNVVTHDCIFVYNTSKKYHNLYDQKCQEKVGFYDKLWKTYLQKEKITDVNRETFIQVTKVIMEGRGDGEKITWKWVQENQQIPYEEFTCFYKDLSNFITSQREGYFNIEKECQLLSRQHNTMLDTFPNNVYNKFIKSKPIVFEYGFTSDSTQKVFETKTENVRK